MINAEDRIVTLVMEQDISSIQILASELRMEEDGVRELLNELTSRGKLDGYITEDGKRYFRKDVKVHPPVKHHEEDVPEFMKYDTWPGRFIAMIGVLLIICAVVILTVFSGILYYENVGMALILIGIIITISGCYYIGRRKTPM